MRRRNAMPGGGQSPIGSKPGKSSKGFDLENMFQNSMGVNTSVNVIDPDNIKDRFNSVAGLSGSKIEIMEFVEFLKNPKK